MTPPICAKLCCSLRCVPLLALTLVSAASGAQTPARSWVSMNFLDRSVRLELHLPLQNLAEAASAPQLANDDSLLDPEGRLADYLEQHVHSVASDGSPWSVRVRSLTRQSQMGQPYLAAELEMRPPAAMPDNAFRFNYDVITRELRSHTALVLIASDWKNGIFSAQPLLVGVLQNPVNSMPIDRSPGNPWRGLLGLTEFSLSRAEQVPHRALFLLLLPVYLARRRRWIAAGRLLAMRAFLVSSWLALLQARPFSRPLVSPPAALSVTFQPIGGFSCFHD